MSNRIRKSLQLLVGRFELRRPAGDTIFQCYIEFDDFKFSELAHRDISHGGHETGWRPAGFIEQGTNID